MGLAEDVGGSFIATGARLGVKDATLIKVAPGTRTNGALAAGTNPTTANYACKGFVSSFSAQQIDGTLIRVEDRKISIFGSSLTAGVEPKPGDRITIEGITFNVINDVERDPASVKYVCHGRR